MNENSAGLFLFLGGVVVFFSVSFVIAFGLDALSCASRWNRAGLEHSYGPLQGCMVKTPSGLWMPEKQYINARVTIEK